MLVAFHKPFGVLSQFTPDGSPHRTLAEFGFPKNLYPIGRLDADSEGLLLLSDEARWTEEFLHPQRHVEKTYWALVERVPTARALQQLGEGVVLDGKPTRPAIARLLDPQPDVPPRDPPVRMRKSVVDVWIELRISEGKNRQVRRMTSAVGHPTLRLVRVRFGHLELGTLLPGSWQAVAPDDVVTGLSAASRT